MARWSTEGAVRVRELVSELGKVVLSRPCGATSAETASVKCAARICWLPFRLGAHEKSPSKPWLAISTRLGAMRTSGRGCLAWEDRGETGR